MEHGTLVVERRKKLGFMRVLAVPKLVPRIGIAEQTCNNETQPVTYCLTVGSPCPFAINNRHKHSL